MSRFRDREKALELRKQEMSYSQIRETVGVSKSTLSLWLRNYPLSKERILELRGRNEKRIERYRETMRQKRERRLQGFYKEQKKFILPLNKREKFLAGLFLYWGEGTKSHPAELSISNTDPSVINFFIDWLIKELSVPKERIKIQLQLYSDMNVDEKINFWVKALNVPKNQFAKPYIKRTSSARINHKGGFGHGTCNARVGDARLAEKILMAIKVIADKYIANKLRA